MAFARLQNTVFFIIWPWHVKLLMGLPSHAVFPFSPTYFLFLT